MSAINEWNAMTEAKQFRMMERCIYRAAQIRRVRVDDAAEYIGGTWERVAATVADADDSLVNVVLRAAGACIQQEHRAEQKRDACLVEVTDRNGESVSVLELIASGRDSVEQQAILRADLEQFLTACDDTNLKILLRRVCGYTEREISAMLTLIDGRMLSHVGIHKRLVKIREALQELVA